MCRIFLFFTVLVKFLKVGNNFVFTSDKDVLNNLFLKIMIGTERRGTVIIGATDEVIILPWTLAPPI